VKKLTALFFILFACNAGLQAQTVHNATSQFSAAELQDDFTKLRAKLEHSHANLYLYTNKATLDHFFDSLYAAITQPMTSLEFYSLIAPLSSVIKNGHSYVLPSEDDRNYYNKHALFMPLHITWLNNKMYADMNCSTDTTVKAGSEILSINGIQANNVMQQLLTRQVRDGNNTTYPIWILNNYFREYYSYIFGHPEQFIIQYKGYDNTVNDIALHALPKDSINFYARQKYTARLPKATDKGIALTFNADSTTATLAIKTFDNNELKERYHQNFKPVLTNCFQLINKHAASNLILDLRNNQGGDPENGILLLSCLLSQPFEMIHQGPVSTGTFKPASNNYRGRLYVLVNGGSFSNTGMVSACLVANNRGIFVGEETGGNQYILTGDPETFILPHTKIQYEVSTTTYLLKQQPVYTGHGVMPAYTVSPTIDDIVNNQDTMLQFVFNLISRAK